MSLLRLMKIKTEALKLKVIQDNFQEMLNEYLTDSSFDIMDKADLTEWLEKEGLGDYL